MANGAYIALSAAVAAHKQLDVVANNLANVNTTGFKQHRMQFTQVLVRAQSQAPAQDKGFVQSQEAHLTLTQGPIETTHNPLDIALHGDGFLLVEGPDPQQPMLTRNGALQLSQAGQLVDAEGRRIVLEGPGPHPVLVDGAPIEINEQGEIFQGEKRMGQLRLVTADPESIRALGTSTYFADPQSLVSAVGRVRVLSGHLETSNVNAISNLTQLIEINRGYQTTQRILDRYAKADRRAIDTLG